MKLVSFPKGATLYQEKDPGDSLFLILSGSIRVLTRPAAAASGESTAAYLSRGDILGEMALLVGEPRANTAVVDKTADTLVLSKKDFEEFIEKTPVLALHLSRLLSNRLAAVQTTADAPAPATFHGLVMGIPGRDQVVLTVNLGLSLVEQTRQKTLLVVIGELHPLLAKSMGLENSPHAEEILHEQRFRSGRGIDDLVLVHPSGLEILCLSESAFFGSNPAVLFPFFEHLRDQYDACLFALPAISNDTTAVTLAECKRILLVSGPQSQTEDHDALSAVQKQIPPSKRVDRVWLMTRPGSHPSGGRATMRLPWDPEWSRQFAHTGSPFLPMDDRQGRRGMDRIARHLGERLLGFAMGSGAAFGYSLIGMLRVLERENIFPDVISGTSMGALIGSFYAAGIGPDQLEEIAKSITKKRLWTMVDLSLPRSGLIAGRGVLAFLKSHLGDRDFDDLFLPFSCVATDINTGAEVDLDSGNVAEAVRASLSLPFFFQPHYLNGRYLVDGGLVNPVPTSLILSQGANILLSANLTSKTSERKMPSIIGWRRQLPRSLKGPSIPEVMMKTIYTMQHEIAAARSELADVVIHVPLVNYLWWDLHKAGEIIRLGEACAEECIPKLKSLLPFFAESCKVRLSRRGRKSY